MKKPHCNKGASQGAFGYCLLTDTGLRGFSSCLPYLYFVYALLLVSLRFEKSNFLLNMAYYFPYP
jgi:hypothetical protein